MPVLVDDDHRVGNGVEDRLQMRFARAAQSAFGGAAVASDRAEILAEEQQCQRRSPRRRRPNKFARRNAASTLRARASPRARPSDGRQQAGTEPTDAARDEDRSAKNREHVACS